MMSASSFVPAVLALALVAALPALAQEDDPLVGDRPDFTESAVTIAPGHIQIETGATHTEADAGESQEIGEILLRIGLAQRSELRIGLSSYARLEGPGDADQSGFVDPSLGMKVGLGEAAGWTTALLLGTTLPAGSSEFREPHLQPDIVFAAERDLSPTWSLGTNLGYGYASEGGERFGEVFGSVALGRGVSETTGVFFEAYGTVPASTGGPDTWFVDGGVTHGVTADLQLDFRVGAGLNSAADDWLVGAGLVWRRPF